MLQLGYKQRRAEQFGADGNCSSFFFASRSSRVLTSVFISDHFQPWKAPRLRPRALSRSHGWARFGARTSRITIGTSVMTPTFRYHPTVVAQAFATLGVMFPDRVVLGVGTGESLNEVPSTGMAWHRSSSGTVRAFCARL